MAKVEDLENDEQDSKEIDKKLKVVKAEDLEDRWKLIPKIELK